MKFVLYEDRKAICTDLNKIYDAVNLDNAEYTNRRNLGKMGSEVSFGYAFMACQLGGAQYVFQCSPQG